MARASEAWWKEWSAEALAVGGKRAHAFARPLEAWRPTTVTDASGEASADPIHIASATADKYLSHWEARSDGPTKLDFPERDEIM
eukprot:11156078-Lingulodinium_polyedra.AAC.1